MQHIALVPLIGGMAIAGETVLGSEPKAVVSYDAFDLNDGFYMNWLRKRGLDTERISLDSRPDYTPDFGEIDLITSVCPCSGLSAANTSAGAGCQQNEWMYKSTEWALSKARPRVLIGENAPRLFGSFGQMVAINLRTIAERYGYTMMLVKTSTHFHGIPQKRERSFFLMFRDRALPPMIHGQQAQYDGTWINFLDTFDEDDTKGQVQTTKHAEELWRISTEGMGISREEVRDIIIKDRTSLLVLIVVKMPEVRDRYIDEYLESEDRVKASLARKFNYTREKMAKSGVCNVWDDSPLFVKTPYYPSVMHKTVGRTYRHDKMRTLTPREQMRLMGLPESMDVPQSYLNAIAQNVPTCTAGWIIHEAMQVLDDCRPAVTDELIGDRIFRFSNLNGSSLPGMLAGNHLNKMVEDKVLEITPNYELQLV